MSEEPRRRRTRLWPLVVLVWVGLAAGAVLWAALGGTNLQDELTSGDAERMRAALAAADTEALQGRDGIETSRLTVQAMKQMSIEELTSLWENDELSEEDRDRLGNNMRTVWMNYMGELADRFFAADPQEKEQLLDQQLDEFMEFRKRMEDYYESRKDDPEFQKEQEEKPKRWQNPSKEDRKSRIIEMDPDRQMRMANMWMQMSRRAKERGIDFGKGPSGRRKGGGDRDSDRGDSNRPRSRTRSDD